MKASPTLRAAQGGWANDCQKALDELCSQLRDLPEIAAKKTIRFAVYAMRTPGLTLEERYARPGDDCAAFRAGDGYQLLAMEGMLPDFVRLDPKAAGWSSVMVNVSDIAAMGGRATAMVNAYWHHDNNDSQVLIHHMQRACEVFGLAFAGGHSSIQPGFTPGLAVAITGVAGPNLLSCHHLRPGQRLFMLTDLTGSWHGDLPYWGCVQGKTPEQIRHQWQIPAQLAEEELVVAAKDISNGGVLGTLIMMLELTGCGASLDLSAVPRPKGDLLRWLRAFQSFGFLLAAEPEKVSTLIRYFQNSHLTCQPVGTVTGDGNIRLDSAGAHTEFWDVRQQPLTFSGDQ
jgi:AIR synthase-related protein